MYNNGNDKKALLYNLEVNVLIEVQNLVKKYGDHTAVKNISFKVDSGKIYGFLGPNGAGKSTTMNIMTGCLAATDGKVIINGHDIFEEPKEARRSIGYLPEQPPVYMDMTPIEYLTFVGKAKGVKGETLENQISDVMKRTGIDDVANRLIKHLSKGYRQRVGLAQALIGDPEVIILDEPMVGLDPKQIIEIRELIKSLGENHTVFLSSHILSEISAICDYVMIISDGKLVASDTPNNLSKRMSGTTLDITVKGDEETVVASIRKIKAVESVDVISNEAAGLVKIRITSEDDVRAEVFFALCEIKSPIIELTSNTMSLESIFLKLTEDNGNDNNDDSDEEDGEGEDNEEYTPLFTSDDKKGDVE